MGLIRAIRPDISSSVGAVPQRWLGPNGRPSVIVARWSGFRKSEFRILQNAVLRVEVTSLDGWRAVTPSGLTSGRAIPRRPWMKIGYVGSLDSPPHNHVTSESYSYSLYLPFPTRTEVHTQKENQKKRKKTAVVLGLPQSASQQVSTRQKDGR